MPDVLADLARLKEPSPGLPLVRCWVIARRLERKGQLPAGAAGLLGARPADEALDAEERVWQAETDARRPPQPAGGPGTELTAAFDGLGFASCPACKRLAAQMDRWGSKGCRKRYWRIVGEIKDRASDMGWAVKLINWGLDPIPGFVTEAIERAEAKGY